MKLSIIGSGNTATILGRLFKQHNFIVNEIISRNKEHAFQLAKELNATAVNNISLISKNSDVYIIAVKDEAVETVAKDLNAGNKIVVHTSGSVSINVLQNASKNYGVLYPLQSLRKELSYLPVVSFLVDGNNAHSKKIIKKITTGISANVMEANDEQRLNYHLSAVIVSNFTNYLFSLAKEYCLVNDIEFSMLMPLIEETVNRLHKYDPALMQTGPAARDDTSTMQKHLALLENFPQLQRIYQLMSKSILASGKK